MDLLRKDGEKTQNRFGLLYLVNFIISFHLFFIVYFNSNFLTEEGLTDRSISLVYMLGSALSILGLFVLPKILKSFGNYSSVLVLIILQFAAFSTLAFYEHLHITLVAFLGYLILYPLILVSFDIFLERNITDESTTGSIRGVFLTVTNSALIIAPLIAGFLLSGGGGFRNMYFVAGAFLIPLFAIIAWYFKGFSDPQYTQIKYTEVIKEFSTQKGLFNIFASHFSLRLFFSFMVVYTPLFLHNTIGFTFSQIGVLFAIMLLPFALFEIPLGRIADRFLGLIAGLSTVLISFMTTTSFIFWAILLFVTRVGASAIEIMTESHFFKHVAEVDAGTISLFRMLRPLGYIVGPMLGFMFLSFLDIRFIFIIPGLILLCGIFFAARIKDTK